MRMLRVGLPLMVGFLALAARSVSAQSGPADTGLVTVESHHSVAETIARFEAAVTARGWTVFTVIDHAAAARAVGLQLDPRSVVVFGHPERDSSAMQSNPTLAIDLPMKALVWQDGEKRVWLTYNSADYAAQALYPRHGLSIPPDARAGLAEGLRDLARQATD